MNDWNEDDNRMLRGWLQTPWTLTVVVPATINAAPAAPSKDWTKIETYWPHLARGV